ncbi:MAG: hypothetical protein ACRYGO_05970 [Janthinobacterium lividum]
MKFDPGHQSFLSVRALVLLASPVFAQAAAPLAMPVDAGARPAAREYTVINLAPLDGAGVLNQLGQVAFTRYSAGETGAAFFDGRRLHRIQLQANGLASPQVVDLSDAGLAVVVASVADREFPFNARAFSWSLARGARLLTGSGAGSARAVNERGQIAGYVQVRQDIGRATRWNPDGSRTVLGGFPMGYSEAMAINDGGLTAGYFDNHATVWDAKGGAIDLGAMGGTGAIASFLNARNQAAGTFNAGGGTGVFVWRQKEGLTRIGPFDRAVRLAGFNDRGQVAAGRQIGQEGLNITFAPFTWSAPRGLAMLPLGGAAHGMVNGLNNRGEMVGYTQRAVFDEGSRRAMYWNDVSPPADLNARLYRAPAGLQLSAATAINDDGTILAQSNAGLVLLRPGRTGTPAPVLGPLVAPPEAEYASAGRTLDFGVSFVDSNPTETHAAAASVDDGCPQAQPSLREVRGSGDVSLRHTFCRAGTFSLVITVKDRAGNATRTERQIYVGEAAALP